MVSRRLAGRYTAIAMGVALAFSLPLAAHAADQTTHKKSTETAREKQLEARVDQLEQELAELKGMIQQQRSDTAQAQQTAVQAQQTAQATQAQVQTVAAAPAPKPQFTTAPGMSVALHGWVSASAFSQSKNFTFGNGQNAEYPVPGSHGSLSGVDIRNTRFWLDFTGAKLSGDWIGGGRIEMDFFGGFNGTGAYAQQQAVPRLRQAYMDLINPETGSTVRIGQQWDLLFPIDMIPTSLSHIAFPLGFSTGVIGWRYPGVVWMQDLNHGSDGTKWRLDLAAFEGSWSGPGNNINFGSAGSPGFRPQIEARLHAQGSDWLAFAAGHYSREDLRGVGDTSPAPIKSNIKSTAFEVGASWKPGPWNLKGQIYTGNALGQQFGAESQFGDIQETGGFVQVGYNFTKNWSVNAFYGMVNPDRDDVVRWIGQGSTGMLKNRQSALSLQYAAGAYELGVEVMHDKLDSTTNGQVTRTTSGNQVSLNGLYKF
ncbi:hypothetical protein [Dyella sp.]|uniref:hypothetical protein n=1 Tax=Dyella sp. TaxID=1869338 RepID=UPI002ED10859